MLHVSHLIIDEVLEFIRVLAALGPWAFPKRPPRALFVHVQGPGSTQTGVPMTGVRLLLSVLRVALISFCPPKEPVGPMADANGDPLGP